MITPRSFTESLMFSTIRIETIDSRNNRSVGTGFFFKMPVSEERIVYLLITNRHVVRDAVQGMLCLHLANGSTDHTPGDKLYKLTLGDSNNKFESMWTTHADSNVDLCALNFSGLLQYLESHGINVFFQTIDESFIYSDAQLEDLMAVEDVIMVGYPIGLADDVHNLPLIRSGSTASHPAVDFCGQPHGVVDMACFPGSSGSPIFLYNTTMFYDKVNQVSTAGPRQAFLGVLFAGPQHNNQGEIIVQEIPTSNRKVLVPITRMMIHLGYYIKSRVVTELGKLMVANIRRSMSLEKTTASPG